MAKSIQTIVNYFHGPCCNTAATQDTPVSHIHNRFLQLILITATKS